jgi:hypothetical protein
LPFTYGAPELAPAPIALVSPTSVLCDAWYKVVVHIVVVGLCE